MREKRVREERENKKECATSQVGGESRCKRMRKGEREIDNSKKGFAEKERAQETVCMCEYMYIYMYKCI